MSSTNKRYQVFISSTYLDLQEERQEVIQALLELDCIPAGMELFPASDDEKWDLIKSVIDDSDFYIVIIGGRYGSVDQEGISFTEKEYDYAVATKKPVLGFVHADPDELPGKFLEKDPDAQARLDTFREKVQERMCKLWKTADELGSVVSRSLVKSMKDSTAVGWVRADGALTPEQAAEMSELRAHVAELETERERTRTTAPLGTEVFAQGGDTVEVGYEFWFRAPHEHQYTPGSRYTDTAHLSWDEIFGGLGPAMFNEASEGDLSALLAEVLWRTQADTLEDKVGPGSYFNPEIDQTSFDTVKIQLVALRLIEKSDKKHGVHDKDTYWTLTPYGETYVMGLHAIRRVDEADPAS